MVYLLDNLVLGLVGLAIGSLCMILKLLTLGVSW